MTLMMWIHFDILNLEDYKMVMAKKLRLTKFSLTNIID